MPSPPDQQAIHAAETPSRTNWAGNYTYTARQLTEAESQEQLQQLLPTLHRAKAVGSRHSFNHLADSPDTQVALTHLKTMSLDRTGRVVQVGAGVTYGELAPWLDAQGFALRNLASLPHISVAGACATGTHGSGLGNRCLSSAVVAMELLDAEGNLLRLSRAEDEAALRLATVHLGALGVVTSVSLEVIPTFQIAQTVYLDLSFDVLEHRLREVFSAGYSVSLFTDWQNHRATQAWVKREAGSEKQDHPGTFYGAHRQTARLHPLPNMSAESCTEQMGEPGPWFERLPHFRMDYTPSAGAEIQTEYFVPLHRGYEAIAAVESLRDRITPHLLVSELRTVAADTLPLSMCFGRDSLGIHFTWKRDVEAVKAVLPVIEAALAPFDPRPHWAKLFTMAPAEIRARYPAFSAFHKLLREMDPDGRFHNAYLEALLDMETAGP